MKRDVPAPGYQLTKGKTGPTEGKWWVQLRCGWCDLHAPWPADGPRWKWGRKHDDWDVVAVRKAD